MVGQETYGPNWQADWIDAPASPEYKLVLQYLRAALKAGQVAAHWSTMDFRAKGDLTPQEADHEFFRIDVKNGCVFHDGMNEPVRCRIHAEQLRSFMRNQERRTAPPTQFAIDRCRDWLIQEFSDPTYQPPKLEDHWKMAEQRFERLSKRGFKDARKQAIEATGRHEIAKAGRPKKSNQPTN